MDCMSMTEDFGKLGIEANLHVRMRHMFPFLKVAYLEEIIQNQLRSYNGNQDCLSTLENNMAQLIRVAIQEM